MVHTPNHALQPIIDALPDLDAQAVKAKTGLNVRELQEYLEAATSVANLSAELRVSLGELMLSEVDNTDRALAAVDEQMDRTVDQIDATAADADARARAVTSEGMAEQDALLQQFDSVERALTKQAEAEKQGSEAAEIARLRANLQGGTQASLNQLAA